MATDMFTLHTTLEENKKAMEENKKALKEKSKNLEEKDKLFYSWEFTFIFPWIIPILINHFPIK